MNQVVLQNQNKVFRKKRKKSRFIISSKIKLSKRKAKKENIIEQRIVGFKECRL